MSYIYRLALAHREELIRQAAERRRVRRAIRTAARPPIRGAYRPRARVRVLRLRRLAARG
jgi:hypothetical protein